MSDAGRELVSQTFKDKTMRILLIILVIILVGGIGAICCKVVSDIYHNKHIKILSFEFNIPEPKTDTVVKFDIGAIAAPTQKIVPVQKTVYKEKVLPQPASIESKQVVENNGILQKLMQISLSLC